jgi:hypothetical protein
MSSIRQRIFEHLEARFKAITVGATRVVSTAPERGEYEIAYGPDNVTRKPIDGMPKGTRAIVGIYAGKDNKTPKAGVAMHVAQEATLEIHISREVDEALEDLLEQAVAEAERVLMEDMTCGGLAIGMLVRESETDVDGFFSGAGSAALYFTILFKHHRDDPSRDIDDQ